MGLILMPYYISPPPRGPLTRIVTAIFAAVILVGAFTIGIAALLVVAGVGVIAGIALWIRVAWMKHKLRKSGVDININGNVKPQASQSSGRVIDAEYTVISEPRNEDET